MTMQTTTLPPAVNPRRRALIALLLLVPAPTIGVACMLHLMPDAGGKIVSFIAKAWIALLPLLWTRFVECQPLRFPRLRLAGIGVACVSGVIIFLGMLGAYLLVRSHIDLASLRARAAETGFDHLPAFLGIFVYIITINSLLEEYVWRWFVVRQCEVLLGSGCAAVVVSALLFTVHHVVALAAWVDVPINALASFGVFIGGATWSWLYLRYRNIWAPYVSHVFADVAILLMGYQLIFAQ